MDAGAYLALKTLHIVSSTVLFGTGLGTAFHFWMAHRTGRPETIAAAARTTVIADFVFTTPAVLVQPATGVALALSAGHPLTSGWIAWALALYAVAGLCWIPVVVIQLRLRRIAGDCARESRALTPAYHRLARAWFLLGWPAFLALLAVFWLMVAKPA